MTSVIKSAQARRAGIQSAAHEMGIDAAFISNLVDDFYRRVRSHTAIGPIFDLEIGDDWDQHLQTMKEFWASVAHNAGSYSGKPRPAHKKLIGVEPSHFEIWLNLFEETLSDTAPGPEVVSYFMIRAHRIAASLQAAMFGSAKPTTTS